MTEVAFHFGAPDKVVYACRLLRKAVSSGALLTVIAEPEVCAQLDEDLWALGPTDFVPHCQDTASESVFRHTPLVLTTDKSVFAQSSDEVLVQLVHPAPDGVSSFKRVIELVGLDEDDRVFARQRWKAYAAAGLPIKRHDLALKGQS